MKQKLLSAVTALSLLGGTLAVLSAGSAEALAPACGSRASWQSGNYLYVRSTDGDGNTTLTVTGPNFYIHTYSYQVDC